MLELTLPRPPSVNGMYATNFKTKRRFKSKKYSAWLLASEAALTTQRLEGFLGPIQVDIAVGKQDRRKEDISNRIKAVEDFLVTHEIIEDDSLITRVSAWWDKKIEGCLVTIKQED